MIKFVKKKKILIGTYDQSNIICHWAIGNKHHINLSF